MSRYFFAQNLVIDFGVKEITFLSLTKALHTMVKLRMEHFPYDGNSWPPTMDCQHFVIEQACIS